MGGNLGCGLNRDDEVYVSEGKCSEWRIECLIDICLNFSFNTRLLLIMNYPWQFENVDLGM